MEKKFSFENRGTNTYLVYELKAEDEVDSMSLGMLTHNKIDGLAETSFSQVDSTKYIKYNVSSRVSVNQFFSGPVNRKRLLGVFTGIVDAMLSVEEYMIDESTILLDLDYIFADVSTCDTVLICLPLENREAEIDLGAFFKNVMFSTRFDQTENCDHVAEMINYLNSAPTFSLTDFKALLKKLEKGGAAAPAQTAPAKPASAAAPAAPKVKPAVSSEVQRQQPVVMSAAYTSASSGIPASAPVQNVPAEPVRTAAAQPLSQPVSSAPTVAAAVEDEEEKMSLIYLLRHYDKENAAIYKAQQEAEKAKKASDAGKKSAQESKAKAKKEKPAKKKKSADADVPYSTPSASGEFGFAIPGQKPSLPIPDMGAAAPAAAAAAAAAAQPRVQPTESSQPKVQQVVSSQPAVSAQPAAPAAPAAPAYTAPAPAPDYSQQKMSFGETTILTSAKYGETTVLGAAQKDAVQVRPYLVRQKNNEKIMLNKPVFRIGKEKSYVDYFIGDNPAISRSHANIISRDGSYFVVDTNSTNHTYVNGTMIGSNEEVPIDHGTIIGFANESFEFKLY